MARAALVTGGSRGIGAAAAACLARAGFSVAIGYGSSKARAEALAASLRAENRNAMAVEIDVCDRASVRAALERVRQRIGAPDTLVLCAGVAQQKLFQDISDADWDRLFDVNVKGVYRCAQEALPEMLRRGRGCIVTVASMWGEVGASCESHYAASKGAVIALSKSLAKELGPSGIRVNCVSPGVIETDMTAGLGAETLGALAEEAPLGRNGRPEDVAQAILCLCSEASAFVTGRCSPSTAALSSEGNRAPAGKGKGAVITLSKSLAKELGPSGIRVNCVSPGVIETDMTAGLGAETLGALAEEAPLGRNGRPEDVAQAILCLCSEASAFVTGRCSPSTAALSSEGNRAPAEKGRGACFALIRRR